eukprot:7381432-Prymnesium_polylepis.3
MHENLVRRRRERVQRTVSLVEDGARGAVRAGAQVVAAARESQQGAQGQQSERPPVASPTEQHRQTNFCCSQHVPSVSRNVFTAWAAPVRVSTRVCL